MLLKSMIFSLLANEPGIPPFYGLQFDGMKWGTVGTI
jgi:hypothetical protein